MAFKQPATFRQEEGFELEEDMNIAKFIGFQFPPQYYGFDLEGKMWVDKQWYPNPAVFEIVLYGVGMESLVTFTTCPDPSIARLTVHVNEQLDFEFYTKHNFEHEMVIITGLNEDDPVTPIVEQYLDKLQAGEFTRERLWQNFMYDFTIPTWLE